MAMANKELIQRLTPVFLILFCGTGIVLVVLFGLDTFQGERAISIAGGRQGGAYMPLAEGLATVATQHVPNVTAVAIESEGGVENIGRLMNREVTFALVQNDVKGSAGIRTVAPLYKELLHIVVRKAIRSRVENLTDIEDLTVAIGSEGSGTADFAKKLMAHFGMDMGAMDLRKLGPAEAGKGMIKGEIDVLFILSALPSEAASEILQSGAGTLLSLGDTRDEGSTVKGIQASLPFFVCDTIPKNVYGLFPEEPVGTVGVVALLATHADVDDMLVTKVSEVLFEHKVELANYHASAALFSDTYRIPNLRFPYHGGAEAFYRRDSPPFLVQYAEFLSLTFTVLVALISGTLAVKQYLKRAKKDRIDRYYNAISDITTEVDQATDVDLNAMRSELEDLRHRAFRELIAEKLSADESFSIFQEYFRFAMGKIDERLRR